VRDDPAPAKCPSDTKARSRAARAGRRIGFFDDGASTNIVVVASLCDDSKKHGRSYAICQNTGRPRFFAMSPVPPKKLDVLRKGGSMNGVGAFQVSPPCEGGVQGGSDCAPADVLKSAARLGTADCGGVCGEVPAADES
jgi:hypothetical protein